MLRTIWVLVFVGLALNPALGEVTFSRDVAPIFFKNCVACHRPGEIAPMSLMTFEEARPWARSIASEVRQRSMPPWSGESESRVWVNDLSLSEAEIEIIVGWVEQGARPGNPTEQPQAPTFPDSWTLGEPDYIIELNPVDVPAEGEDLFLKDWATIDIDSPKWVRAIEFLPGDRRVTHHFQSTINNGRGGTPNAASPSSQVSILAIWTAGMPPYVFPEGMGRLIQPGAKVLTDSHYHPMGEAATDRSRIGLYFGKGELRREVFTLPVTNTGIRIPPGAPNHEEFAFYDFDRDMHIHALSPHMHVRGKAMRYDLIYPDGAKETILDVPNYDYNWQWLYYPTEPIAAPAGSRMEVTAVWDNSPENPSNPDPTREIIYRGDTFNEMFVGFMEVSEKHHVYQTPAPIRERIMALLAQHPAEDSIYLGGFLPLGVYLPETGPGWMYLVNGSAMFTISLHDYAWDGRILRVSAELPTPEASATTSLIEAEVDEKGRLRGTFRYGLDTERTLTLPVNGEPLASRSGPTELGAAR
jgi:hypothetical protein